MDIPSKDDVQRVLNSLEVEKKPRLAHPQPWIIRTHGGKALRVDAVLKQVDNQLANLVGKR